jgi:hypothetical protein
MITTPGRFLMGSQRVVDDRDVSPRMAPPKLSGRLVRAYPAMNGTTVEITEANFIAHGIHHPTVTWDFRINDFTVEIGEGKPISEEAAEFLCSNFPDSFKLVDKGK